MKKNNINPSPEKLFFNNYDLIRASCVRGSSFGGGWHFHPEYELVLITKSRGTALIGDYVGSYSGNELYFTGVNLPHTWLTDNTIHTEEAEALVLHFKPDLFSRSFLEQTEFAPLQRFLNRSKFGVRLSKTAGENILHHFRQLLQAAGIEKLILILKILDYCSHEKKYSLLASEGFTANYERTSDEKLQEIFAFIEKNHSRKIHLNEVAKLANMQANAFCRYFKQKTNSSLIEFINKVRVGHACRLLLKYDLSIQEICYKSGFNTSSNFINQFRLRTNKTPKEYRDYYHDKLKL